MRRNTFLGIMLMNIVWMILMIEHFVFHLELAEPFSYFWGILTMLVNIVVLAKNSIQITYE